jgi:hypothetical protein
MKKLLIAGDSYASETFKKINCQYLSEQYSWPYILKTKYQITNISCAGTSLAWIYKQLTKENFENFDKVIVCVTAHGRLTFATTNEKVQIFSLPNYATLLNRLESNPKGWFTKELNWAKFYYENFYDEEIELITYEALLNKLINLIPKEKLILIPCFRPRFLTDHFNINFCLKDITNKEINWHCDFKKMHELYSETDQHVNHMSMENKNIFAKLIEDLVEQEHTDITLDNFIPLDIRNFDIYYKKN